MLGPNDLACRNDKSHAAILLEEVDDASDPLRTLEYAVEQCETPSVAIDAMLALLGVNLGHGVIAGEQSLVEQSYERRPVATAIGNDLYMGLRVGAPNERDCRFGVTLGHGHQEVIGLGHARETILDVTPQFWVMHMGNDRDSRSTLGATERTVSLARASQGVHVDMTTQRASLRKRFQGRSEETCREYLVLMVGIPTILDLLRCSPRLYLGRAGPGRCSAHRAGELP